VASIEIVAREGDALSWRPVDEGRMLRTSHALACDGGAWLIDPIDGDGLDAALADLGPVAGVILTLGRHGRDSRRIAERHSVDVWGDEALGRVPDGVRRYRERVPGSPLVSVSLRGRGLRRWWREVAIWWPERRLAVVGESVGNAPYFLRQGERLGLHPLRRGAPPPELADLDVDRVLCGHGDGVPDGAASVLGDLVVRGPSRRGPLWLIETFRTYRSG
jgi:hypothetical protein